MSKLIAKYIKSKQAPKTEQPTTEGLGVGFVKMLPSTWWVVLGSIFFSPITWELVLIYYFSKAVAKVATVSFSASKALEMLSNPNIHKYIEDQCVKLYKETKKSYPELREFVSNRKMEAEEQKYAAGISAGFSKRVQNFIFISSQIHSVSYKHAVVVFADTTHIEEIYVVFEDAASRKYIAVPIPAPTKQECQKFF